MSLKIVVVNNLNILFIILFNNLPTYLTSDTLKEIVQYTFTSLISCPIFELM